MSCNGVVLGLVGSVVDGEVVMDKLQVLTDLLKPGGMPLPVVTAYHESVISSLDYGDTWAYCCDQARSTSEAIDTFLEIVESDTADDKEDDALRFGDGIVNALARFTDII